MSGKGWSLKNIPQFTFKIVHNFGTVLHWYTIPFTQCENVFKIWLTYQENYQQNFLIFCCGETIFSTLAVWLFLSPNSCTIWAFLLIDQELTCWWMVEYSAMFLLYIEKYVRFYTLKTLKYISWRVFINNLGIVRGRHKNFKDPLLSSQDIKKRKYETFYATPFKSEISPYPLVQGNAVEWGS